MNWDIQDQILYINLCSQPCNEIGLDMLGFFEDTLQKVDQDDVLSVIIYSTNPKGFSAGADLRALYEGLVDTKDKNKQFSKIKDFIDRIHHVFNLLDQWPAPVIVVTHGICFGGGFELALTADMIIAEKGTRFCFPELRLGLIPGFGGIPRLARELPNQKIRDLIFTGRSMQAKHLPELVSQLVPQGKGLSVATKTAQQISKFHPTVVQHAKKFIKPDIQEELQKEKELFLDMIQQPQVLQALEKFVHDESHQPYLPK